MINKRKIEWKGNTYIEYLYLSKNPNIAYLAEQVQAVTFDKKGNLVLYKHIDGYYGFPGGRIEKGESPESCLVRELQEEISANVIDYGIFAYVSCYEKKTCKVRYFLRYWVIAGLENDRIICDPAGKSLGRKIITIDEAPNFIKWGKIGSILVVEALNAINPKWKAKWIL